MAVQASPKLPMLIKKNNQKGFTIIEVAVVVPIISLIVISLLGAIMIVINSIVVQNTRNALVQETKSVFTQIENDVSYSTTFLPSTLPANFNQESPISGDTYKTYGTLKGGSSSFNLNTLFLQGYDQVKNPNDTSGTSTIPAVKSSPPCNGLLDINSSNSLPIAVAYYVDNGILYRRVAPDNTGVTTCDTPLIRKTCSGVTCTPKTTALLGGITQFKVDYYQLSTDTTAMDAYTASPSPTIDQANCIQVTISTEKKVAGETISYSTFTRMNRIN